MDESFISLQAGDEEFRLSKRLRNVSLFVELNLDADEIARVQELFGRLVHEYRDRHGYSWLVTKYPALTLTTMIGHAGLAYDHGKYWESFWAELDIPADQEFEKLLRNRLRMLLRKFALRDFPEFGTQYVQVMAVHAGVPVHCVDDLVDVIEQHVAHGRDPNGAALFEWLTEPGMGYRLNLLDAPVRNFLQFGGEVAVDIVDRIIEFAEYMVEHPDAANDLDLDTSTTGLPVLLLDALIDRLQERPFGTGTDEASGAAKAYRPAVVYSRIDDQIVVEIPYPRRSPETPWLVSFDGDAEEVFADPGWGLTDGDTHPATPVPVARRVRQIVLAHEGSGVQHRIPLVDKDEPVLMFDDRGRLLSRHTALPRGEIIVVHPRDADLVDAGAGRPIAFSAECTPAGWRDWVARVCDLGEVDGVRLRRGGRYGPVRSVRAVGAARLEAEEPVVGVSTRSGLPVYGERPSILLPRCGADPTTWRVRTRRAGTVDWLTDEEWESSGTPTYLDPFDGLDPGLLGLFDVVVSGPLGSDLRHTLFLAEGLAVEHGALFRVPDGDGLAPCVSEVIGIPPLTVDREVVEFDRNTRQHEIRVSSGDRTERLILRPPHIELRVDPVGAGARWRTSPTVVTPDDLADHGIVAVRVPGDVEVDIALLASSGEVAQVEIPQVNRGNVFQVPTRSFGDTVRALRTANLVARVDTPDGATRTVVLAAIRPARLCSGVRLESDTLVFDGVTGAEMAAFVWADTAPWRTPDTLSIEAGRARLPAELIGAGPLTVQVFVDDPWAVITAPARPDTTALPVAQPGWVDDPDPARAQLSRFIAGQGEPPAGGRAMSEIWSVLAHLPDDGVAAAGPVRDGLIRALDTDVRSAVEALGHGTIAQAAFPGLLIRTGLIERDFSSAVRDGAHTNPWIGCLLDIADLPLVKLRSGGTEAFDELVGRLANHGGGWLIELLTGKAGDPRGGIFDRTTVSMAAFDTARVAALRDECEIIPGALLDLDTRAMAMFEAFERRQRWTDDPARIVLVEIAPAAMKALRRPAPFAHDIVSARHEVLDGVDTTALPWMLMSLQSLLMAVTARLTARGVLPAPAFTASARSAWARLAELCPAMVGADLLIADAVACFTVYDNLIGDAQ